MKITILFLFAVVYYNSSIAQLPLPLTDSLRFAIANECCERMHKTYISQSGDTSNQLSKTFSDVRNVNWQSNFPWLMVITRKYGFPSAGHLAVKNKDIDTACNPWSIMPMMTIWETIQQHGEKIFEDSVVALFEREINAGRMKRETLSKPLALYANHHLCVNDMEKINTALKRWGIEPIPISKFFLCE